MLKERSELSLDRKLMRIPKLGFNSNEKYVWVLIVTDCYLFNDYCYKCTADKQVFDGLPAQWLLNAILMQFVFSHQSIEKLFL